MHPIHYSALLSLSSVFGGLFLAAYLREPLVFVIAVVLAFLVGAQTVGRFGTDPDDEPLPDDYQGTGAGFVKDRD